MKKNIYNILFFILITFLFIVLSNGFAYEEWTPWWGRRYYLISIGFVVVLSILKIKKFKQINTELHNEIKALIVIPFLSIITTVLYYGESVSGVIETLSMYFLFLLFYIFKIYKIKETTLVNVLVLLSFFIFFIQVYQQFYPELAIFGTPNRYSILADETNYRAVEIRNDLYRYRIGMYGVSGFSVMFFWEKLIKSRGITSFLFFVITLSSLYLYLSRQVIFASLITLLLTSLIIGGSNNKKFWSAIIIILSVSLIYNYADVLFGNLVKMSIQESKESNIRILASGFFMEKTFVSPLTFLFGNGYPSIIIMWKIMFGFYTNDVGIIGQFFHYGILWILLYIRILYILLIKYKHLVPFYIQLIAINTIIQSFMIFPYNNAMNIILWAIILYIAEIHIQNSSNIIIKN